MTLYASILIKFPQMTREFSLGEGDYVDLNKMTASSSDAWNNAENRVKIAAINNKENVVTLDCSVFNPNHIILKMNEPLEIPSKLDGTKYTFMLTKIGESVGS